MKFAFVPLALAAALGLAATTAEADMQQNLGPLAGLVELGTNGNWTAEDGVNWFILTNTRQAGAIRYYWLELPEANDDAGGGSGESDASDTYSVAVNLVAQAMRPPDLAYAGLLFGYRDNQDYHVFAIGSDGDGYLFRRSPDGFGVKHVPEVEAVNDGTDTITAWKKGNRVKVEVNGVVLANLEAPDGFSPRFGIVAIGEGQFGFSGFSAIAAD